MTDPFARIAEDLIRGNQFGRYPRYISRQDYNDFCFEYLWHQLRGITFGVAFCEKFSIHDVLLIHSIHDEEAAKRYIERTGYVKNQVD